MKYLMFLTLAMPILSWGMEGIKPTITLKHAEFFALLEKNRSVRKFSHTIEIPEQGAHFELLTEHSFHPKSINLDIEKGTKSITIHRNDGEVTGQYDITNDSNKKLAELYMLFNAQ